MHKSLFWLLLNSISQHLTLFLDSTSCIVLQPQGLQLFGLCAVEADSLKRGCKKNEGIVFVRKLNSKKRMVRKQPFSGPFILNARRMLASLTKVKIRPIKIAIPCLFFIYFQSLQTNSTISCEKCWSNIWCWDSKPRP